MINAKDRKTDLSKSSAIKDMHIPTNLSALQTFPGPANYYGNFYPKYARNQSYFKQIIEKDLKWNWSTEYQCF